MNRCKKCSVALLLMLCIAGTAQAERIKDLVDVALPDIAHVAINMLTGLGISLPVGTSLQLKNIAAVMVTASLPAFARPGQTIDVTTSSMGNAKSLRGGTLLMTPLRGADGEIYAVAQGNVLVGGVGASSASGSSSVQVNHLNVGRIRTRAGRGCQSGTQLH